jgi:hypothetical protein
MNVKLFKELGTKWVNQGMNGWAGCRVWTNREKDMKRKGKNFDMSRRFFFPQGKM